MMAESLQVPNDPRKGPRKCQKTKRDFCFSVINPCILHCLKKTGIVSFLFSE